MEYGERYMAETGSRAAKRNEEKKKNIWGWILAVGIAVGIALLVRAFLFEIILVDGPSMEPTLYTNERLAVEKVSRYAGLPQRGDIVIVHYSDGTDNNYVKRCLLYTSRNNGPLGTRSSWHRSSRDSGGRCRQKSVFS